MYVGHTNALTAVLMILPARWAGVALQPLSVPFGPAGETHACRHNLDVPEGYIYKADNCAGPQIGVAFKQLSAWCVIEPLRAPSASGGKRLISKFE